MMLNIYLRMVRRWWMIMRYRMRCRIRAIVTVVQGTIWKREIRKTIWKMGILKRTILRQQNRYICFYSSHIENEVLRYLL